MQRVLLALVVAAALAAIGWFGFWEPEPEPAADDAPRVRNFSGGASPIDFNTLEQDPELKEAGPELEAKGAEKAPPAPAPAEQPPAPLVDGTLVLIDSQGGEQPPATGTIELTWTNPPPRTATVRLAHKVPIEDGRLSFALPRGQRVEPGLFHFDGGVAVPIEDEILVPETGAIEIRAKVVRPTVLHVVDDASGTRITRASVLHPQDWEATRSKFPGSEGTKADHLAEQATPLTLETKTREALGHEEVVFVSAVGYAWQRVTLDTIVGGERTVRLQPAGTLEVTLAGKQAPPDASIRAWPGLEASLRDEPALDQKLEGRRTLRFERFPAGAYTLAVQDGYYWRDVTPNGRGVATVEAGGHARVTIEIQHVDLVQPAPLAGTLEFAGDWEATNVRIQFQYADKGAESIYRNVGARGRHKITPIEGRPGHWRFDAGKVRPGRWQAKVVPSGHRSTITVPPEGLTDVKLRVGEPATVRVRVMEADTGKALTDQRVTWHMTLTQGISSWSSDSATWDEAAQRYVIRAPAGTLHVDTGGDRYNGKEKTVTVRAGEQHDLTLTVRATSIVDVEFRAGDARIPFDWEWDLTVKEIDGEGEGFMFGDRDQVHRVWVDRAGRYRVSVREVPGYKPVAAQEVETTPDKPAKVVFLLERAD